MSGIRGPARWRHVARVTIELTSPLLIGTGRGTAFCDNEVANDANGLPALPGTSLAGILRSAWAARHGEDSAGRLFGWQRGNDGQRSRLLVSWGALHDRGDRPVGSRLAPGTVDDDPLLQDARELLLRDHVRLNHRGVVDGRGKFDRSAVRAGHRFTFELEVECFDEAQHEARELLALIDLLNHPAVRLGGATRAGLGAFKVVGRGAAWRAFDLTRDAAEYGALPAEISEAPAGFADYEPKRSATPGTQMLLELKPVEPYVIGGGDPDTWKPGGPRQGDKVPDLLPYQESAIEWSDGEGRVGAPGYCVPATAIKGALRHRTAWHLRLAGGHWVRTQDEDAGELSGGDFDPWGPQALPGIRALFGHVHDERAGTGAETDDSESGHPGRVFIADVRPTGAKRRTSMHVSIDRFTGAPLEGHLFEDEALEGGSLIVEIYVLPTSADEQDEDFSKARAALRRAVDDLCNGRVQLGAGYGRGYGWFRGQVEEVIA